MVEGGARATYICNSASPDLHGNLHVPRCNIAGSVSQRRRLLFLRLRAARATPHAYPGRNRNRSAVVPLAVVFGGVLAVAVCYFLGAQIGLFLASDDSHVAFLWPPAGIAVAVLFRAGIRYWPGVFAGCWCANCRSYSTWWVGGSASHGGQHARTGSRGDDPSAVRLQPHGHGPPPRGCSRVSAGRPGGNDRNGVQRRPVASRGGVTERGVVVGVAGVVARRHGRVVDRRPAAPHRNVAAVRNGETARGGPRRGTARVTAALTALAFTDMVTRPGAAGCCCSRRS